jgi:ribulose-phosphate 3-epimerase
MTIIIPGISERKESELERKIAIVTPFVECIHLDVDDAMLSSSRTTLGMVVKKYPHVFFEAHCVDTKPELFVKTLSGLGFRRMIAPVECHDPREFISEARVFETEIGLSLDVETSLEEIEPFLEELDFVHIMTAGAFGMDQPFEEETLAKIKSIHRNLPDLPIVAEGGMDEETVKLVVDAGATRIISASYIFQDESSIGEAIEKLSSF